MLATCVHHIHPIESQHTPEQMERVAYDYRNLAALCDLCHERIHRYCNRSRSKEQTKKAAKQIAENFMTTWLKGGE